MARFVCEKCKYKFKSELNQVRKRCPYCGELGLIEEPSAEDFLNIDYE